jgi:hypothetical protein
MIPAAMPDRLRRLLSSPRLPWLAIAIAVGLNLPSLKTGWQMDDLVHRARFLEIDPVLDSRNMTHEMYDFLSGDPAEILAYKDLGVLPWWSHDSLKIAFWRPLSSLTHVADYALWPESAVAMHAHSILWLALLIGLVARLYRRLIPAALVPGLATLLYALDDAHGFPTGFLANRNAIIATSFGVLSLVALDRWRRDGWLPGAIASPFAFAGALLAGESGIGVAPYIFGYPLFLDRGRGLGRWAAILPHGVVGILWLFAHRLGGYGTYGTGFYLDPVQETGEWLEHFVVRAPLLLLGQWFLPPASFAFAWTPRMTIVLALFGILVVALVLWLLRPVLSREPVARWLAFGMLLSVVPITAGFPHDRLLFFVGLGGMGLLAMLLLRLFDRKATPGWGRVLGSAFVVVHVVIAAPLQMLMTTAMAAQEPLYVAPPRSLPDDPRLGSQRLVVLNPPSSFYAQYTILIRRLEGRPAPASLLLMAPGTSRLSITRVSESALLVEAEDGYLTGAFDNVFRAESFPMGPGYRVELKDVRIEVQAVTGDGRPRQVKFTFEPSVDAETFRWVRHESGRYVPFAPPAIGKTTGLDPVPFHLFAPEK